jgi:hypothetical protein
MQRNNGVNSWNGKCLNLHVQVWYVAACPLVNSIVSEERFAVVFSYPGSPKD